MKLRTHLLTLSTATLVALSGCSNKEPEAQPVDQDVDKCYIEQKEAPNWVCNPGVNGGMAGVGSAERIPGLGSDMQRVEAEASARDSLAKQMEVKVQNLFKKHIEVAGVGKDTAVNKHIQNTSKQVASSAIKGSVPKNRWETPAGTLYVRVVISEDAADKFKKDAVDTIKSSYKNENAAFQKFLSKQAMEELDAEVDKAFE
jgi:hypothetical protein